VGGEPQQWTRRGRSDTGDGGPGESLANAAGGAAAVPGEICVGGVVWCVLGTVVGGGVGAVVVVVCGGAVIVVVVVSNVVVLVSGVGTVVVVVSNGGGSGRGSRWNAVTCANAGHCDAGSGAGGGAAFGGEGDGDGDATPRCFAAGSVRFRWTGTFGTVAWLAT
jgi:hypothetical protein